MKLVSIDADAVTVELDVTDCIALPDACLQVIRGDRSGAWTLLCAMSTAFEIGALCAYMKAEALGGDNSEYSIAAMREHRAPHDERSPDCRRMVDPV